MLRTAAMGRYRRSEPMAAEQLTLRENVAMEHLQKAEELGVSLAEYCRTFEIDLKDLYNAKQSLVRKGVITSKAKDPDEAAEPTAGGEFLSVMVTPPAAPVVGPVCSIRHPSGLVIDCAAFPPAEWLTALVSGARRVPARP
jgi:hypothetical protein